MVQASGPWRAVVWAAVSWWAAGRAAAGSAACSVSILGASYTKETLLSSAIDVSGMAVDFASNLLYFNHEKNYTNVFASAKMDLKSREVTTIEELTGQCGFTIDRARGQVYAGCFGDAQELGAGLHRRDRSGRFVPLAAAGRPIQFVYYDKVLYYSYFPSLLLHTYSEENGTRVLDLQTEVDGLVVRRDGTWVFRNESGVYTRGARFAGPVYPQGLAVDSHGDVYVCDVNGRAGAAYIYRLDGRTSSTKLLRVTLCHDLTFDVDDNLIYSGVSTINRLVKC